MPATLRRRSPKPARPWRPWRGIPANGARGGGSLIGGVKSAAFPVGIALGATWNPDLLHQIGKALAAEVKSKNAHVLLAPTVNIHRTPLWGRNFEGYGEDPYLAARMAVAYVRGVQGEGVIPAVKHFAANNQEFERHRIDAVEWIFDVAHNPAATAVFLNSLEQLPTSGRTLAVFAAMHDKDLSGVISPLVKLVDRWYVTQASADRGAMPHALSELLGRLGAPSVTAEPDVASACAAARATAKSGDRVLVFGSFHTVGAATKALGLYCVPPRLASRPAKWTSV